MLRRVLGISSSSARNLLRGGRCLSDTADGKSGNDNKKDPLAKEVLGGDVLDAVKAVSADLHPQDKEAKKKTASSLISRLVATEKATFDAATEALGEEMVADKNIQALIQDVQVDAQNVITAPKQNQLRNARRGLLLLRKEIFYQAVQEGYSAEEARGVAERAVAEAESRVRVQQDIHKSGQPSPTHTSSVETTDKEKKFFDYAYQMAEKVLYVEEASLSGEGVARRIVRADPEAPKLFSSGQRLDLFGGKTDAPSLVFWSQWNKRAAHITNQSFGPENAWEQQVEWTETGKQWHYPINNEWKLGEEEKVPFIEHVFLERYLAGLGLPKTGPIAHFMELVCVGLSKNAYMTAAKKREHLEWFAAFFNKKKQKEVDELHEQEQIAAANAV